MFVKTQGGAHTSCWFLGTKFVTTHAIYKKKYGPFPGRKGNCPGKTRLGWTLLARVDPEY